MEEEDDHSLDAAIRKINQRQREEVYAYLKGEYKSDEPFYWTPDRKDILLFWMLNKIFELEKKVEELKK
jgi:hypothetical protein